MTLAYYMDVHVPAAITDGLRRREVDVLTCQDDGTRTASDDDVLERAKESGRVLFSQDQDLLRIAVSRQRNHLPFSGLILAHQIGATIGLLIEDLELVAKCIQPSEIESQIIYLPL